MSKNIVFIQPYDRSGVIEAELSINSTLGDLYGALTAAGIELDAETLIFIDEAEQHLVGDRHASIHGFKNGCRVHISRCPRVKTTIHYLEKTVDREFPPGTRLRAVKTWAVEKFGLNPKDAAEHVLQLCKSTERPSSDTPLLQLLNKHSDHRHKCGICFDLVPDKRIEG